MKRSKLLPVTFDGKTAHTRADIKRLFGVNYSTFKMRVGRGGMSPEDAVATSESLRPGSKALQIGAVSTLKSGYVVEKVSESEANKCPGAIVFRKQSDGKFGLWAYQHRIVWCRHAGRDLREGENIHHKNGDRADNRLENLELWSTSQPAGQRVKDRARWAREILSVYGSEFPE